MKTLSFALVLISIALTSSQANARVGWVEGKGFTRCVMGRSCPAGITFYGAKAETKALALEDAQDICRNYGGLPLAESRQLDLDCDKNFSNYTISCVARAAVKCDY